MHTFLYYEKSISLFPEALVNELVSDTAFQVLFIECPVEQLGKTEPPPAPVPHLKCVLTGG